MSVSEGPSTLQDVPPPLPPHPGDALPEGARLAEFEIRRVLGAGGFGIVYLAFDHALEREVALKEYMPVTLAGRGPGTHVTIRSAASAETFALGLKSFVNEGRLLARFDHPSLVKVYRFWEDNGTAYMAMPMYHGRTLRQVRQAMAAGSPGEAWCRALIDPMLGALERLHREAVYHRDIAPDNIVLQDDGHAVLLDFGAARRVIGDRTHALTAILKPHFAPIEQYADVASMRQGPWTDLYGLAATTYYLLTGTPPLPAAARALHDELAPLARLNPAGCSPAFLQAVDWAMAVRPQDRPQSVAVWRDVIEGRMPVPRIQRLDITSPGVTTVSVPGVLGPPISPAPAAVTDFDPTQPVELDEATLRAVQAAAAPGEPDEEPVPVRAPADPPPAPPVVGPASQARPSRRLVLGGAAAAVALALVAVFVWVLPKPAAPAVAAPAAVVELPSAIASPASAVLAAEAAAPSAAPGVVAAAPSAAASRASRREAGASSRGVATVAHTEPARTEAVANPSAALTGPGERCADHVFLAKLICMTHECDSDPRLHNHPECVRLRKTEQERRERAQSQ